MLNELTALGIAFEEAVPMSSKTSFKIGGPAELMLFPATPIELHSCIELCIEQDIKPFILGNGSNLLVKDSGLDGVVISTEKLLGITRVGDSSLIYCGAGVKLSDLCVFAQKQGLSGLEFAYGIPGSAGGAAYMNAGAYGGEMKDIIAMIHYVDGVNLPRALSSEKCEFGYRSSIFMRNGWAIAGIFIQLQPGNPDEIKAKMDETTQKRKDKQPLEYPSAGSVFKRPEGHFAGGLIEQCGLKGKGVGGAQVSEKHAGFIVNAGGATASDVRALIALVQTVVEAETGVFLEPEIRFV